MAQGQGSRGAVTGTAGSSVPTICRWLPPPAPHARPEAARKSLAAAAAVWGSVAVATNGSESDG